MNTYQPTPDFYNDYIAHYNHNHDPRNGQFTTGSGVLYSNKLNRQRKQAEALKERVNKRQERITNRRGKKVDKLISKAKTDEEKQKLEELKNNRKKIADSLDKGYQKYIDTIDDYKNAKDKARENKQYKNSSEYKNAKIAYNKQQRSDLAGVPGSLLTGGIYRPADYTATKYASDMLNANKQQTIGNLKKRKRK